MTCTPEYIFSEKRFLRVVLDPPDFEPGSWIGAGNCIRNSANDGFVLCARLRSARDGVRGFAIGIYRSSDGESFDCVSVVEKMWLSEQTRLEIRSLEGAQLLVNPNTGEYHLYVSVNVETEFIWGGIHWQTYMLTSANPEGPWVPVGFSLENDELYDAHHARDGSYGIVNDKWICVYKARDEEHTARPALATSTDGVTWDKRGPLTVDGKDRPCWMSGSFIYDSECVVFIGLEKHEPPGDEADVVHADAYRVGHGGGLPREFVAYRLDVDNHDLRTMYRKTWHGGSEYEHPDHPVLGYLSMIHDPDRNRLLIYVEALDPVYTRNIGINETVERLLVYEVPKV